MSRIHGYISNNAGRCTHLYYIVWNNTNWSSDEASVELQIEWLMNCAPAHRKNTFSVAWLEQTSCVNTTVVFSVGNVCVLPQTQYAQQEDLTDMCIAEAALTPNITVAKDTYSTGWHRLNRWYGQSNLLWEQWFVCVWFVHKVSILSTPIIGDKSTFNIDTSST